MPDPAWTPSDSDYSEILDHQNPWQVFGKVPEELAPPAERPLAQVLWRLLIAPPLKRHQIILGPRRVGKTTVMYQTVQKLLDEGVLSRKLWWLRLDHPLLMDVPLGVSARVICSASEATPDSPAYLFLDELTYADQWDLWLKTFYDENWPLRIVGTSSATASIRQRGTESGVGRWEEHYLTPYMFTEYLDLLDHQRDSPSCGPSLYSTLIEGMGAFGKADLSAARRRFILTGGFPELLLSQARHVDEASMILRSQKILRSDAIEKALYKDIPQAFAIQDPAKLERLLYTLAGQVTGLFSPSAIAKDVSLSDVTVENYVKFLERAFIVLQLNNYSSSEETIQRRGRRIYFIDGAVRNAALLRGLGPLNSPAELGLLVENMVVSHLHSLSQHTGVRLYHWRDGKCEVDVVYDHPEHPIAVEVTVSSRHKLAGLRRFQQRFKRFRGRCFVVGPGFKPKPPDGDTPGYIPLDDFLLAIGCQARQAMEQRVGVRKQGDGQLLLFRNEW